jgi:hypothetical protein
VIVRYRAKIISFVCPVQFWASVLLRDVALSHAALAEPVTVPRSSGTVRYE